MAIRLQSLALLTLLFNGCGNISSINLLGKDPLILAGADQAPPTTLHFYLANAAKDIIEHYSLKAQTGVATQVSTLPTCGLPTTLAIHPSGGFLYIPCKSDGKIAQYSINSSTAELKALTTLVSGRPTLEQIAIDPNGKFAYITDGTATLYIFKIDDTTGMLSQTGTFVMASANIKAMQIHPNAKFLYTAAYGLNKIAIYSIHPTTGALTAVGTVNTGNGPTALAFDKTGTYLWAANYNDSTLSSFISDSNSGSLTAVPGSPLAVNTHPLSLSYAFSLGTVTAESLQTGKLTGGGASTLYVASDAAAMVQILPVPNTGILSITQSLSAASEHPNSMVVVDPTDTFVLSAGNGLTIYKANATTGQLTFNSYDSTQVAGPASIVFGLSLTK